jgi:hypothetical protein
MAFNLIIHRHTSDDEPIYTRSLAAQLARISLDFLGLCEQ